jgi:predicted molibdopterin-dependent oxidoreductase YjgC
MTNLKKISIDGIEVEVDGAMTIIQAAEVAGVEIPRFCYHERLTIAGNCRMCLVEVVGGPPKPAASCAMQVLWSQPTKTAFASKALRLRTSTSRRKTSAPPNTQASPPTCKRSSWRSTASRRARAK